MLDIPNGPQLALQMPAEPSAEDLQFAQQLGVEYVVLWTDGARASYDFYASRREIFERAGLKVYGFGNWDVHNQDAIVLNLPGRDEKVAQYKDHLRALGRAGIPYTTYAHMANGIWSTAPERTRGGAEARAFDLSQAESGWWVNQPRYFMPLSHGRAYSEDELWEHFAAFIAEVAPVAEEAGVRIGIHPDDPPGVTLAGIPRCIFGTYAGYERALAIADSPNVGVCFCTGCWLEGGELMGKGTLEAIQAFGAQGKLFKVHFRNVNQPLPHFVETFVDDGYMDMQLVLDELVKVGFNGVFIADHIPQMVGGPRVSTAYTVGYMKAMLRRATQDRAPV